MMRKRAKLTHVAADGSARMVDVSGKDETLRTARARGVRQRRHRLHEARRGQNGPTDPCKARRKHRERQAERHPKQEGGSTDQDVLREIIRQRRERLGEPIVHGGAA